MELPGQQPVLGTSRRNHPGTLLAPEQRTGDRMRADLVMRSIHGPVKYSQKMSPAHANSSKVEASSLSGFSNHVF